MTDHDFTVNPYYIDRTAPSKLTDHLYLSGIASAQKPELLRSLGITAVVNLTPVDDGCAAAGFKVHQVGIDDVEDIPDPQAVIGGFLAQMDAWKQSGEVVLVHCIGGISRTSAFAIAWLMHERGCNAASDLRYEWSRAEDDVGAARDIIMPHWKLKRAVLAYFEQVQP